VSFFVMSIHGTNPPGAKEPQGQLYKPEPTQTTTDSTKVQASL
jgi:cytochrome c oxidase cbb3-type subunit 3